ncbi:MAG: hypothetical protein V4447_00750 [Pseudomonadota bacterium]
MNFAHFVRKVHDKCKLQIVVATVRNSAKRYCPKKIVSITPARIWVGATYLAVVMAIGTDARAARPIELFKENANLVGTGILFAHSRELGVDAVLYATSIDAKMAYGQLNEKDRQTWKSQYETMPDGDEPPFPVGGLISILRPIAALASVTDEAGVLIIHLEVDSEGKPRKADLLASPTPEFGPRAIASVMGVTYKPGKCHGLPCTMSIPLRITLIRGGNI